MVTDNLPRYMTPFIGRQDEIAAISGRLREPDCRLLTLIGPGGSGKTRLAVEVAHSMLNAFPDGVYFVPLQPLQAADAVVSAVIDVLPLQLMADPTQGLVDYLRLKHMLLILDNFEHVLGATALVDMLMKEAPRLRVLVTSREMLNLRGEWIHTVAGLIYLDNGRAQESNLYSAVELFKQSARRVRDDFSLEQEREHVIHICQLVGGMPLGIELAAGWASTLTCAEIAAEIERGLDILSSNTRNVPERHRSMQAVFDHSWRMLTNEEKAIMRRFSVFRGGCRREAAEEITGATLKQLAGLVAKSMLRYDPKYRRYDVQELLRQYAQEQLIAAGDSDLAHRMHNRYYAAFMQERAPDVKGSRQLEALNEIEADWNNVRSAWSQALAGRNWDGIGQMMETLHLFCDMRARYTDGATLFQAAVDALEPDDEELSHPLWGELLVRTAEILALPESKKLLHSIMALLDQAEQKAGMRDDPMYLWVRGRAIDLDAHNLDTIPLLEASASGFRTRNERYYAGRALRWMAFICSNQSDDYTEQFARYNQQYLALTHEIGDETGMAHAFFYEGRTAFKRHQLDEAAHYFQQADAIWRKMGDWKSIAIISYFLGAIAFSRGDFEQAKPLLGESAQLASEVNYPGIRHWAQDRLGTIACLEGDYATGQQILVEPPPDALPRPGLLIAALGLGNFQMVRVYLQKLLRWYGTQPRAPWYMTNFLVDDHPVKVFPIVAMLLAHEGEATWAVELLARQASNRDIPMGWYDRWELLTQVREKLERHLGQAAFDSAWQRGTRLDDETSLAEIRTYLGDELQLQITQALIEPLSSRELEVLSLIADGLTNREIADQLYVGVSTVKKHINHIYGKLDVKNRTSAVARARELELLQ